METRYSKIGVVSKKIVIDENVRVIIEGVIPSSTEDQTDRMCECCGDEDEKRFVYSAIDNASIYRTCHGLVYKFNTELSRDHLAAGLVFMNKDHYYSVPFRIEIVTDNNLDEVGRYMILVKNDIVATLLPDSTEDEKMEFMISKMEKYIYHNYDLGVEDNTPCDVCEAVNS